MKFYSDKEKAVIGRYFKYYRLTQSIKLNQLHKLEICGHQTYTDIEEGKIKKTDEWYDEILKYYNIEWTIAHKDIEYIEKWTKELYTACYFHDEKKIIDKINEFKETFPEQQVYINEIKQALDLIERFYINGTYINKTEIFLCIKLCNLFKNEFIGILINVCERSNYNYVKDNKLVDILRPYLQYDSELTIYWRGSDELSQMNCCQAVDYWKLSYNQAIENKNSYMEFRSLMDLFNIYRDIDDFKSKELLYVLENRIKDGSVPIKLKVLFIFNLGMFYFYHKDYMKAYDNFKIFYDIKKTSLSLAFMLVCADRCKIYVDSIYLRDVDEEDYCYEFVHYYLLKNKGIKAEELEKYILHSCMKKLKKEFMIEPWWSLFRFEMKELNKNTKKYKNYHILEENLEKYIK